MVSIEMFLAKTASKKGNKNLPSFAFAICTMVDIIGSWILLILFPNGVFAAA